MAKFPSQNKFLYQTGGISNDTYTVLTSGGTSGHLNLPKDASLLNRRGYASTTRKGVPLVFQCKVDFYLHDEDGQGPSTAMNADLQATLKIDGVQNNWVIRNAAVKWHAALQAMRKKAGIRKSDVGAYAHEIRYGYDAAGDNWLVPIDGNGDAFTGGTWDYTRFADSQDSSFGLKLVGIGVDEDTASGITALQIGHSYLNSRRQPDADSNQGIEETPAEHSHLMDLLQTDEDSRKDEVTAFIRDDGDNVPYEVMATETTNHDITEPVELGRAIAGFGNAYGSVIVDIPFGIANMRATVFDAADTDVTPSGLVCVEVLDIYEMQG
jgi:hypothetical protein